MRLYDDQLIVVTGAAGFIGSCFVRYLNDLGITNLLLVDRFEHPDQWKNLVKKRFVQMIDKGQLFHWLDSNIASVEAIVHLGASTDTLDTNDAYLFENNYDYSRRLLEVADRNNLKFVYASSAATYGLGVEGFEDDPLRIAHLEPLNMYGYSKQLFDQWVVQQGMLDRVVGLKYFNVYGPNESHKGRMASPVKRMVEQIKQTGFVELFESNDPSHYSNGEQLRDWIYVKDVVRITHAFLTADVQGIFNVGTGEPRSWNEFARILFSVLNIPENIKYISLPEQLSKQYQNYTCASTNRLKSALGEDISRCVSLETGVSDYINNYILPGIRW